MINQNHKVYLLFLLLMFTIMFVSSNGLVIDGNTTTISVNKTYGTNYVSSITLRNADVFTFYNVSFETNPYVNMTKIPTLIPNESVVVPIRIFTDEEINLPIRIKGFYETNVGDSNRTFPLEISYSNGITDNSTGLKKCSFTIIKGDTLSWHNNELSQVEIRNMGNNEQVALINSGDTFNFKFTTAQVFAYKVLKSSFDFTGTCEITVLDTTGFVNNPELDAQIQLITNMSYVPTTIQANILQRDYTINFTTADEGILSIKNTGTSMAKNVKLDARWFTFTTNNFDLLPGQTKSVGYRIYPLPEYTNQTNKTTNIILTVSGNFPPLTEGFSIFVPYAEISYTNSGSGSILDMILQYCLDHPTDTICKPKVVYINYDNGSANMSIQTTRAEWDALRKEVFLLSISDEDMRKRFIEIFDSINGTNQVLLNESATMQEDLNAVREKTDSNEQVIGFYLWMVLTVVVAIVAAIVGLTIWRRKQASKWENMK